MKTVVLLIFTLAPLTVTGQDSLYLINSEVFTGRIKALSATGTIVMTSFKGNFEREFDLRMVNLARFSDGSIAYKRPSPVKKFITMRDGNVAVYEFSSDIEKIAQLQFPTARRKTIVTHLNVDSKPLTISDFNTPSEEVDFSKRQVAEIFQLHCYATNAFLCLVEFTNSYRITWHFYSQAITKDQILNFVHSRSFKLQSEWSYYSGFGKVLEGGKPFIMTFDGNETCLFDQGGKISNLVFRVNDDQTIGFKSKESRGFNTETIYEVVDIHGNTMRYSSFITNKLGVVTRQVNVP